MADAIAVFPPGYRITDSSNNPVNGGSIEFYTENYAAALTVYSDVDLSSSLGSTVYLNSAGVPVSAQGGSTEVQIYTGDADYALIIKNSGGTTLRTYTSIRGATDTASFEADTALPTRPVIQKSSNYIITSSERGKIIEADATGGSITLTLPSAVTVGDNWLVGVKATGTGSGTVTISPAGSQTLDGSTSGYVLSQQYDGVDVVSDGANWHIISAAQPHKIPAGKEMRVGDILNASLSITQAANALTIDLKTLAGTDPSATDPVVACFRSSTSSSGSIVYRSVISATTLVISSGSSLGTTNSIPFKVWLVLFDDSGTIRLGVINCLSGTNIYPLGKIPLASSSAEGGAGGADSAHVFYTGSAVTSKSYVVLGSFEYSSGLGTVGSWSAAPSIINLHGTGCPLPGDKMQDVRNLVTAGSNGTTVMPLDNTIPQNTEGDELMTQAITPTSAANVLDIEAVGLFTSAASTVQAAIFQDTTADALAASAATLNNGTDTARINYRMKSGTASSTTFKYRAGPPTSSTLYFNSSSGGSYFNGVVNSYISIAEYVA